MRVEISKMFLKRTEAFLLQLSHRFRAFSCSAVLVDFRVMPHDSAHSNPFGSAFVTQAGILLPSSSAAPLQMMALATEALLTPDCDTSSSKQCSRDPSVSHGQGSWCLLDTIFVSTKKHALSERCH